MSMLVYVCVCVGVNACWCVCVCETNRKEGCEKPREREQRTEMECCSCVSERVSVS